MFGVNYKKYAYESEGSHRGFKKQKESFQNTTFYKSVCLAHAYCDARFRISFCSLHISYYELKSNIDHIKRIQSFNVVFKLIFVGSINDECE